MENQIDGTTPLVNREEEEEVCRVSTRTINRRITVEPILILYFMAYAPSVPLYQQFVYEQISGRNNFSYTKNGSSVCEIDTNSSDYKKEEMVQSESTQWSIYFSISSIVPSTFIMVFMGPYTDEKGRKFAMYLPLFGAICKLAVSILVVGLRLPFEYLVVGCVLEGLSGGIVAITTSCFAYIADVSTIERRALRIFLLEISIGVGVVLSDVAMGYAIKVLGYFYPFLILLALYILNFLYTFFAVQESILKRENVKFFTTAHIKKIWTLFAKDDGTMRRWKIDILMVSLLFICAVDLGNSDIQTYKLLKSPICFTSVLIGYYVSVNYAIKIFVGTVFLKLTFRRLRELWILILSCTSATAFNLLFPFATTKVFAFCSLLVNCISSLGIPMIRSYTSKLVTPREQGTLMTLIAWIQSVAALFGGTVLDSIYSSTVGFYGGLLAFLTAAGAYIAAGILAIVVLIRARNQQSKKAED